MNNCILWFLIKLDWVFMLIFVCPLKYHNEHYFGTWQKKRLWQQVTKFSSISLPYFQFILILIMEIMPCGDLLGFLRKSRGLVDKYYRLMTLSSLPNKSLLAWSFLDQEGWVNDSPNICHSSVVWILNSAHVRPCNVYSDTWFFTCWVWFSSKLHRFWNR